ncbi:MAG: hypothetical protein OXI72_00500 [Gemmatimonadota bacterium]|nr:hypothetical protein [Gemmatimonadota bacterium]
MGTRTIQLDDDAEATLSALCNQTGLSISEVLKRGLRVYAASAPKVPTTETPYQVFSRLDLGPGGYAIAPAKCAKTAATEAIRKKHQQ